jgi:catechol 2,3-dioxygenase
MALDVCDLERSKDWYRQVLGFEVMQEGEARVALFHHEGRLGLALARSERVRPGDKDGRVLDHVALYVVDRAGLDEWVHHLKTLGIEAEVEQAGSGWSVSAFDPDGNEIELFTPAHPAAGPDERLSVDTRITEP